MAEGVTAYVTELDDYDRKGGRDYLEIPLPNQIEQFDSLRPALEERHRVIREDLGEKERDDAKLKIFSLKRVSPEEDKPSYIRIDFESKGQSLPLELKGSKLRGGRSSDLRQEDWLTENLQYYLTIPARFIYHDADSPIYGFEKGDGVTLEVNHEEDHMRIYSNEGYRRRDSELSEDGQGPTHKRLSFTVFVSVFLDLTEPDQPGKRFRIIPFDPHHEVFTARTDRIVTEDFLPSPKLLDEVIEKEQLPRTVPRTLSVKWDPKGQGQYNSNRGHILDTVDSAREVEVELPTSGTYKFETETSEGTHGIQLDYDEGDSWGHTTDWEYTRVGNWESLYLRNFEEDESLTVYVPCRKI